MKKIRLGHVIYSVVLVTTEVHASCVGVDPARGNELFFNTDQGWKPISQIEEMVGEKRQNVSLVYVVKDKVGNSSRKGVVVVKGGFDFASAGPDDDSATVALSRPELTKNECSRHREEIRGARVSSSAYDRYHDEGRRTPEDKAFERFHVAYPALKGCHSTNSSRKVRWFGGDRRSNLSQFSFNDDVVKGGTFELVTLPFRWGRAFASDQAVTGRFVKILKYEIGATGYECLRFSARIGPGAFLGVNDLENKTLLGGDNKKWRWSR